MSDLSSDVCPSDLRVDGARRGNAHFYALLNQGKQCLSLDPATAEGRAQLLCLIGRADIVIESSRPRALRQLGIDAEKLVCSRPGLTWIAISGYGRTVPEAAWIAYGDDETGRAACRERVCEYV